MIRFTLISGPMQSGKTTHLAQHLIPAQMAGRKAVFFRPAIDTRKARAITFVRPVFRIDPDTDAAAIVRRAEWDDDTQIIAIDEVQFIARWTADFIEALRGRNIHIMAAGLDLRADGTPWPGMERLAELADPHILLTSTCARCGKPATMTLSTQHQPQNGVRIGDAGYEPVCRDCWEMAHTGKAMA